MENRSPRQLISCCFHLGAQKGNQMLRPGQGLPWRFHNIPISQFVSHLSWETLVGGKLPKPIRIDREKLPFHCQCGQHLWLQDLPPTVGALWDPSERPVWTEEKEREGKTHFSQEKKRSGDQEPAPSATWRLKCLKLDAHSLWANDWGVPRHHPLTALLSALQTHPT